MVFEFELFRLYALVLARVSGLVATAPIIGSNNVPVMARAGFAATMALVLTPVVPLQPEAMPEATMTYAALAIGEFLIGAIIGFAMTVVFAAVQMAGQIMDMQTGFGVLNVFNPALESQVPIFGFFLFLLAVLYLIVINGHHLMIRALAATYNSIPIGGFSPKPDWLAHAANWGTMVFWDGLMISAPIATAMLLAYVTMGFLSRVVPQIHLFVIGFPFTIATGLLVTAMIIGFYLNVLDDVFFRMFRDLDSLIRQMG